MKFYCICDYESSLAYKVANIVTFEVNQREKALEIFKKVTKLEDAGLVIITDSVASLIQDEIQTFVMKNTRPLILELPSYSSIKSVRK